MAFGFTTYVDTGVYQQEVIVPSGVNIAAQPFAVCLIGTGSRNKRVTNEAVLRGILNDETLTVAGSAPYTATLASRADRRLENTTITRTLNGIDMVIPDAYVHFNVPYITGTVTSTVDLNPDGAVGARTNAIGIEMDGHEAVTIAMYDTLTFTGTTADNAVYTLGADLATVTLDMSACSPTPTLYTSGVRPGTTLTTSGSEDGGNDGTWVVLTVTETVVTFTNTSGVTNADDDTTTITFSGVGRVGRELTVIQSFGGSLAAAATMAEIRDAINTALGSSAGTALGYGPSYGTCASVSSSALRITSAETDGTYGLPNADVRVFAPFTDSGVTIIFGAAAASNRDAQTIITLDSTIYNASATYTADYVAYSGPYEAVNETDPLSQTSNVQRIVAVGSTPGGTDFTDASDYLLTSNAVDWSPDDAASITARPTTTSQVLFDVDTNTTIRVRADGKLSAITGLEYVDIVLRSLTLQNRPIGYVQPTTGAATVAQICVNINAVLAQHFGPRYAGVAASATVSGYARVRLTSPMQGRASSSVEVEAASSVSATALVFGGALSDFGLGKRPAIGSVYFVSYEYTRPANDYEIPYRHTSVEAALAQVGQPSAATASYNPLAIAVQLAFENGAQTIYTVQVDDTSEGNPSRNEVRAALEGAGTIEGASEIVVVGEPGTRISVVADMVDHLETQCGPVEKHYRRIYVGMASGASIGSRDIVESIVGRATRTLQVSPSSPGRGRMFMMAPPQLDGVSRDIRLEDSTNVRVDLDGTYLGVAFAAARTALQGPADTMTKRSITGFNTDDVTALWKPAERRTMAGQGVNVVTYDAGRFKFMDAKTTEEGGGGLVQFAVDSTSFQKDIVVKKVDQALDDNIVGIVPFDPASFVLDIKLIIQGVIENEISKGTIGPYRVRETGQTRNIDARTDIRVAQNVNIPTEYNFSYWFVLRYPALRLLGQYSVDNPFFALAA